ncbi:hypothetical protein VaNZ11_007758 [Volvox africanus]|uniref:AB hydrolase-1 domain-containing protein n=1 Tax=Volvox africanus TaxID=51714 RepID=A0ABQ5S4W1_9CHLO|nr:hypothetical protein VaNZ11_007758 [Volvox africanus]
MSLRLPAGGQIRGQRGLQASQHHKLPHHFIDDYLLLHSSTRCADACAQASGNYNAEVDTGSHTHIDSLGGRPSAHSSGINFAMSGSSLDQTLSFPNSHGERLSAKFVDAGSKDIVIFCHGYASSKNGFLFPRLAEELASRGKSSLRFDFAGNGESEGTFSFGNYFREVEDLRAAVGFARDTLKLNVGAIVGHSKGANVVLLYASRYDDVPHVVSVAGRGIMSRGIKKRLGEDVLQRLDQEGVIEQEASSSSGRRIKYLLTKESVDERMKLDMLGEAAKIQAHVLILHGSSDNVIPVEDAHMLASRIPQHTLCVVEGADHNFRQPVVADMVIQRIAEHLASTVSQP